MACPSASSEPWEGAAYPEAKSQALGSAQPPHCWCWEHKVDWGASAYSELHSAVSEEQMRSGFNPQPVPMAASGALLRWLNTLWVLLLAPAAELCKDTLALPTAGFGLGAGGVHTLIPQISLKLAHSRAGHPCDWGGESQWDVGRAALGR